MEGFEGERISTPVAVAYFRSGQASLIFFNSRRHFVRKSLTIFLSPACAWSDPNWR